MSHNSKYYAKKIKKSHQGSIPLTQFGFKISNQASEACVYDNEAVSNQAPEAVSYQAVETELHQTPEINQSSDADFRPLRLRNQLKVVLMMVKLKIHPSLAMKYFHLKC